MRNADLNDKYQEAQVLYILVLYKYQVEEDFVPRLVSCYKNSSSDEAVIRRVNREFQYLPGYLMLEPNALLTHLANRMS